MAGQQDSEARFPKGTHGSELPAHLTTWATNVGTVYKKQKGYAFLLEQFPL